MPICQSAAMTWRGV